MLRINVCNITQSNNMIFAACGNSKVLEVDLTFRKCGGVIDRNDASLFLFSLC